MHFNFGPLLAAGWGAGVLALVSAPDFEGRPSEVHCAASAHRRAESVSTNSDWTVGLKRVLFLRVSFPDDPTEWISEPDAAKLMDQVNAFFQENSYGLTSLRTTVTPLLTLPQSRLSYNGDTLMADARQVAAQSGYPTRNYDLDCVYCPWLGSDSYGGIGQKGAWLVSPDPGEACHEFGHNFGLSHANSWISDDGSVIGPGHNFEYGHIFDTMGYGFLDSYPFNAFERHLLRWLPDSAIQTVTRDGIYELFPIDVPTLDPTRFYALRIPKDSQRDYWVEIRQQTKGRSQLEDGLLLLWSPWSGSSGGSQLLNATAPNIPALQAGHDFYDLDLGLKITPLAFTSATPKSATVLVKRVYYILAPVSSDQLGQLAGMLPCDGPSPLNGAAALAHASIPVADSFVIWFQTAETSPGADGLPISVTDGNQSRCGMLSSVAIGDLGWRKLCSPSADRLATGADQLFPFTAGEHTIGFRVDHPACRFERILITNDPATNLPPILSKISDRSVVFGTTVEIPFSIVAIGQSASLLSIHASSDYPTLLPETGLIIGGDGPQRTLSVHPVDRRRGTTSVTLTVSDTAGRSAIQTFSLTVLGPEQALIDQAVPGTTVALPAGVALDNLVIDKDLIIEGSGPALTILDGGIGLTGLTVATNTTVTLRNLTIRNARADGIRNYGTLNLVSCVLQSNQHCGLNNFFQATLSNCEILSNGSSSPGGGIINQSTAHLKCDNGCIANNRVVNRDGGGIYNLGDALLEKCTICENLVTNSAGTASTANRGGGGIWSQGFVSLHNVTLCRNQSDGAGGGVDNLGEAHLANTLIAGNLSRKTDSADCGGTLICDSPNLIQNPTGSILLGRTAGNILGEDPLLASLGYHGGLTQTVPLLPGSPAIDGGDCPTSSSTDQRGAPRPVGAGCDIGAFEFQLPALIQRGTDGTIGIQLQVVPNHQYAIEASSDLASWLSLGTYLAGADGLLKVRDASAASYRFRFYQLRN
jgi:hypothetical protein